MKWFYLHTFLGLSTLLLFVMLFNDICDPVNDVDLKNKNNAKICVWKFLLTSDGESSRISRTLYVLPSSPPRRRRWSANWNKNLFIFMIKKNFFYTWFSPPWLLFWCLDADFNLLPNECLISFSDKCFFFVAKSITLPVSLFFE